MMLGPTASYATPPSTAPAPAPAPAPSPTPRPPPSAMVIPGNIAHGGGYSFNSVGPPGARSDGGGFDGSLPPPSSGSSTAGGMRFNVEPAKKKRGRPRKYAPDGNIALGLSPSTPMSSGGTISVGHADSGGRGTLQVASEPPSKRNRGRPPGSGKRQIDALGGAGGTAFTPHVITVEAGEDVVSKVMAFSQEGPRTVCILSANGAICNVTIRQLTAPGGSATYEGRFEIISLSGSPMLSEDNGGSSRAGNLIVSLAGPDGNVVGGEVAGMLIAASTVRLVVGSFILDPRKSSLNKSRSGSMASQPPQQMLTFGAPLTIASPSQGASSESSDEIDNSNAGQPMHNMQMYRQLWAEHNPQ